HIGAESGQVSPRLSPKVRAGGALRLRVARASETAVAVGVIQTTCVSLLSDCSLSVGHWSVGLRVAGRITEIYVDSALVSGPLSRGLGFPDFSQVGLKKSVEIWSLRPLMPALQ